MWLVVKYSVFAFVAISVNIVVQDLTSQVYGGFLELYLAMTTGTLGGLITKYYLDKRYIFYYRTSGLKESSQKFFLYSAVGIITTLIFWGFEISFDWIFNTKSMRYLGGIIGLTIGYWTKYQIDKRFVFTQSSINSTGEKNRFGLKSLPFKKR